MIQLPALPIEPKVNGQGTVYKKDGSVSKPEQPKEKEHGSNPGNRSA